MDAEAMLTQAMKLLETIIDSDDCPAAIRYDAQQLYFAWCRGEHLKKPKV